MVISLQNYNNYILDDSLRGLNKYKIIPILYETFNLNVILNDKNL